MTVPHPCRRAFFSGTFVLSLLASASAQADSLYDFQDLGTLGGTNSGALGLNAAGDVVGFADDAKNVTRGFVWRGAGMQQVATPPSVIDKGSRATGIGDSGDIVGVVTGAIVGGCGLRNDASFRLSNGTSGELLPGRGTNSPSISSSGIAAASLQEFNFNCAPSAGPAFRFQGNTQTALGALQTAFDVNDAGVVVGAGIPTSRGFSEATTFDGVTRQTLGTLCVQNQSCASTALSINNQGAVVGESATDQSSFGSANVHAFAFRNQSLVDLGTLAGFEDSRASAVDDVEDVVGSAMRRSDGAQRAVLFGTGTPIDLNTVTSGLNGFTLLSANDVRPIWTKLGNFPYPVLDGAYIVGVAEKPGVGRHAFRLTSRVVPVNAGTLSISGPFYGEKPALPDSWYRIDLQLPEGFPCAGGLQVVMFDEKLREQVLEPAGFVGDLYPYFVVPQEAANDPKGVQIAFRVRGKLPKGAEQATQAFCRSPRLGTTKSEKIDVPAYRSAAAMQISQ